MTEPRHNDDVCNVALTTGYMGDPEAWCYYDSEYAEEGSVGPFTSEAEANAHAIDAGWCQCAATPVNPPTEEG